MDFKNSKTYKNLEEAFAGESMARNKYDYYASKAKKDGYEQIAAIFAETALNEKNMSYGTRPWWAEKCCQHPKILRMQQQVRIMSTR